MSALPLELSESQLKFKVMRMTDLPDLAASNRDREYRQRTASQVSHILTLHLFESDVSHRDMDERVLGLDPRQSKGWQSMGVLHYFGLKKEFKGIFKGHTVQEACELMKSDKQDFSAIIHALLNENDIFIEGVRAELFEEGELKDSNFQATFNARLEELENTDSFGNGAPRRLEQGLLRGLLFGKGEEAACAICQKRLPTDLLVAAHIKPRSSCTYEERVNPRIVMSLCKLGCDDFFEKGYLLIDQNGKCHPNRERSLSDDLRTSLELLNGVSCTAFDQDTSQFFADRENSFRLESEG